MELEYLPRWPEGRPKIKNKDAGRRGDVSSVWDEKTHLLPLTGLFVIICLKKGGNKGAKAGQEKEQNGHLPYYA